VIQEHRRVSLRHFDVSVAATVLVLIGLTGLHDPFASSPSSRPMLDAIRKTRPQFFSADGFGENLSSSQLSGETGPQIQSDFQTRLA
jgi:hypothetical protein